MRAKSEKHEKAIKNMKRRSATESKDETPVPEKDMRNHSRSEIISEKEKEEATDSKNIDSTQWGRPTNDIYIASPVVVPKVMPGLYKLGYKDGWGIFLHRQRTVLSDDIIDLPVPEIKEIISDIKKFWNPKTREKFKLYDMTYKRGIIVWGPPGNGKSYMMQTVIKDLIELDGVVLSVNTVQEVEFFTSFCNTFRKIEPTRPLVVILEDIDNVIEAGSNVLSALMNVLDGINQIDNVVYLATTNYPEKLQERISNRPSRFDRKYEIGLPSDEVRRVFIDHKMNEEDKAKYDVEDWVAKTEGLSLSHLKELVVSVCILEKELEEVLVHFQDMKRNRSSRISDMGFVTKKPEQKKVPAGYGKK